MAKPSKPSTSRSKSVLAAAGTCAAAGIVGEGLVCSVDGLVGDGAVGEAQAVTHTGALAVTIDTTGEQVYLTFGGHPLQTKSQIRVRRAGGVVRFIRFGPGGNAQPRATNSTDGQLVGVTGGVLTGGGPYAWTYGIANAGIANDYVPVKFEGGGETHYGWIEIGNASAGSVELVGWGFDDVDGHFPTLGGGGGGGGVPEPGTLGLGLLALGAAGVSAYKRRRASAKRGTESAG